MASLNALLEQGAGEIRALDIRDKGVDAPTFDLAAFGGAEFAAIPAALRELKTKQQRGG